jgi:thiol:disulfide interchange protein DsbC
MNKPLSILAGLLVVGLVGIGMNNEQAVAAAQAKGDAAKSQDSVSLIEGRLRALFNELPDTIAESPLKGIYEAIYGSEIFYVSADAEHLIRGDLFELATLSNLTEERRGDGRLKIMSEIPESSMIVYKAKNEKHVVTVFTDIDCGYCRKLHKEMAQYNDIGITMRYVAFPRAGANSPSYDKLVSVWCADDPLKAMDAAKNQGKIEQKKCDAPIDQHMVAVRALGLTGTPAMVFSDGRLQPGYSPAARLLATLEK